MGLVPHKLKIWHNPKDKYDGRSCKDYDHMAEHGEGLRGGIHTEAEWKDVSEWYNAKWESDENPLCSGILLVENMEQDNGRDNRDIEFERIKYEIDNPVRGQSHSSDNLHMFQLRDPFNDQVADHNCDHNWVSNRTEENYIASISCCWPSFKLVIHRICSRPCLEFKFRVVCRRSQDRLVHKLGEENAWSWRGHVDVADKLVTLALLVSFVDFIRSVHIWLLISFFDPMCKNGFRKFIKRFPRFSLSITDLECIFFQIFS